MPTKPTPHTFMIEGHQLVAYGFNTHLSQTPVVLLHGITASANSWLVGPPPVLAHYPWYSLSLPGHFPAQFPLGFASADLTPELVARLVSTAVRQLAGGRPAILIGHSTGGFAALAVAATAPELVAGVVCISGFVQGRWTAVSPKACSKAISSSWGKTDGTIGKPSDSMPETKKPSTRILNWTPSSP